MMTANVNVNGSILKISVGEGRQTFKWLAQIIQARIAEANLLKAEFGPTNVIVIGLKNHADQLINPTDSLFEHQCKSNDPDSVRSDDLTFTAEVLPQFESDQFGNPVYGEWLQTAYMVSESAQKWATGMQQWRDTELERQNEKNDDSDDDDRWNPNQNAASSLIHIGDEEFLKIDLKTSFMLDWGNIKFAWLDKTKLSLKISIHEVLKENYDVICHLFLHYCGVGTVGQRFGMTLRELNHLLTLATRTHKEKCTQIAETVYKKITRIKEPKKRAESGKFVMKAPPAAASGSGFAKPTSPVTNDSDSESPTPPAEFFEELPPEPEEPPVEEVPAGPRLSPLLSRSAFAECLMCYAVEEEMGSSIPEAITNFICGPLKAILATFHRTFVKYSDAEAIMIREEYDSLREFFSREAEMHPTLGASISFEKFSQIVTRASLLSESRVDKEQEGIMCEEAYCHSLLTTRNKGIKLSALRSVNGNRKMSYGFTGYEAKDDDYSDGETSPKYGEDPLLGVDDPLVFTEFAEGIAKLATEEVGGGFSPRDRETSDGTRIKLFYELLITDRALIQPEVIEDPGPEVIPEPEVVIVAEQKVARVVPRVLNRTNFGAKSTTPSIREIAARELAANNADLKKIKAESKASSKSFRK